MRSYGFAPLRLPEDLDFTALFHGVDERVPVEALEFLLERMKRTKNNKEFFATMAQ